MPEPRRDPTPGTAAGVDVRTYRVNGLDQPWRPGLTLADIVAAQIAVAPTGAAVEVASSGDGGSIAVAPVAHAVDTCGVDTSREGSGTARDPRSPPLATSINGRFVARARRPSVRIAPGDQVLLFQPIVGG